VLSINIGSEGDLVIVNHKIWVRYAEEWCECMEGKDDKGRPLQRHPSIHCQVLHNTEWKTDKIQIRKGKSFAPLLIFKLLITYITEGTSSDFKSKPLFFVNIPLRNTLMNYHIRH